MTVLGDARLNVAYTTSVPWLLDYMCRRHAASERLTNLEFVRGAIEKLPPGLTRFALHHLSDPHPALTEMVRVCGPGDTSW